AKEHDRCGSHLVAPLLSSTVAGTVAARRAGLRGPAVDGAIALGSMAIAVEIFGWSERHSGTVLARALRRPGYEIQRVIGTRQLGRACGCGPEARSARRREGQRAGGLAGRGLALGDLDGIAADRDLRNVRALHRTQDELVDVGRRLGPRPGAEGDERAEEDEA